MNNFEPVCTRYCYICDILSYILNFHTVVLEMQVYLATVVTLYML